MGILAEVERDLIRERTNGGFPFREKGKTECAENIPAVLTSSGVLGPAAETTHVDFNDI
jgi:hypothetical protein